MTLNIIGSIWAWYIKHYPVTCLSEWLPEAFYVLLLLFFLILFCNTWTQIEILTISIASLLPSESAELKEEGIN